MLRSLLSGGMCAAVLSGAAADEQALRSADTRIVLGVEQADLEALVTALGHTLDAVNSAGEVSVRGLTPDGLRYLLIGTACEIPDPLLTGEDGEAEVDRDAGSTEPVCVGISMQVRYNADTMVTLEKVNRANVDIAALNVWYDPPASELDLPNLVISRYVILDGGQSMGNLKANLNVLLGLSPLVTEQIWELPKAEPENDIEESAEIASADAVPAAPAATESED